MEESQRSAAIQNLSSQQADRYLRYVKEAKEAAKNGDLEEALKLFSLAKDIYPNEKVMSRIQKLQEALEELAEEENDEFTDVCNSGLLLYRELHNQLFEYQKEGVAFLYSLYRDGKKGGILADDMGLGKTVQIIAFLSGMFDASFVKHVLLIMPTSLINIWIKEFARWTPGMRVKTFHGPSKDERIRNLRRIQQRNGIIITTYQMLINNWQHLASFSGQEFVWDYVILDEAHKIKSSSTKTAVCARCVPTRNRLLLTGTPIQNNLQELWSLFDFACQGSLLGTLKTFRMEYENPIVRAREKDATPGEKALGLKIAENLMAIIKPYFLRRTKEEVQKKPSDPEGRPNENTLGVNPTCEMPSLSRKNDLIVWIRLVPLQEEIYRKFTSLDHIKELLMESRSPLAELGVLKKLCDHPRLLSARVCGLLNLGNIRFSAQDVNEGSSDVHNIDHITDETLMNESGKMIFLMDLLKRLREEGHQTLVFSQSIQILNIIERLLKSKHFKVLRIDGTVTHLWEREKRIQLFQQNKEYSVFLLTTLVGGVGLTLTAASRVVIFDPSWNPATDAQAVDRVYRIGQKENVVIYRLITCGTVEEKIYRRQVFKDSLIRQTTGDKKNPFRYFTKQELRELFTIEDLQYSVTQLQLQSLHAAQRRSDEKLDEHITYLHSLGIAGISDHDLMYTHDVSTKEELDVIEESQYIQQRVQKAQFLVELECQNTVGKQSHENEEAWQKASALSSKKERRCTELQKRLPQPSPFITTHYTQEENISSHMANISLDDQSQESEPQEDLSSVAVTAAMMQDDSHPYENKFDADSATTVSMGVGSAEGMWTASSWGTAEVSAVEEEALQKEALQERPLGSLDPLLGQSVRPEAEPGPDLELQDSEVLHSSSPWPINPMTKENKCEESNTSIKIADDSLSASHRMLQVSQGNEADTKENPSESLPQYICDFNLFLEDSADNRPNVSSQSLEQVGKEESPCGPAVHSRAESVPNISSDSCRQDDPEEAVVLVKTRRKARRIVSDDEDEDDSFKGASSTSPFSTSPFEFTSMKQFDASTPKNNSSQSGRFFSPTMPENANKSSTSRRSLASRRSLINVVLDHVEDMEEELGNHHDEGGAAADSQGDASSDECTEKDPPSETLPSKDKSSELKMSEPSSSALQISAAAAAAAAATAEPLYGEPLVDLPQEKVVEAANDYETLVARGKELKESGKIQDALNCFVKALDIKSVDPEVMLMTLNLYKQLNNT
ncbi:DNA excision repair protein ERCC-6-like [Thomomys bottae]